jgi:hypothetical protein
MSALPLVELRTGAIAAVAAHDRDVQPGSLKNPRSRATIGLPGERTGFSQVGRLGIGGLGAVLRITLASGRA